jgi:hypothetical protein
LAAWLHDCLLQETAIAAGREELLNVHPRTVRRWLARPARIPATA